MAKLSKDLLVAELQEQLKGLGIELSKKDTQSVFTAYSRMVEEAITAAPTNGYDAFGLGFATVKIADVAARQGVSAMNGQAWSVPAHKKASFKLASGIKETLKASTQQ